MNPNLSLALAIGGGLVGLVVLHAVLSGQSAAASAITVGATLTSPFNLMGDTSGSLVNNATVSAPASASTDAAGATGAAGAGNATGGDWIVPAVPAGVPLAGWGAALGGMNDIAGGHAPSPSPAPSPAGYATFPLEGAIT